MNLTSVHQAVAVAQLVEWLLGTPEIRGLKLFFLTQPQLVLLPRLTDLAHRRILGPQAESTPAWEELVWL